MMKQNVLRANSILAELLSLRMVSKDLIASLRMTQAGHLSLRSQHYHLILKHYWLSLELAWDIRGRCKKCLSGLVRLCSYAAWCLLFHYEDLRVTNLLQLDLV